MLFVISFSLVKMVYAFADSKDRDICWHQLVHAILRNFGGLDNLDPVLVFQDSITALNKDEKVIICPKTLSVHS